MARKPVQPDDENAREGAAHPSQPEDQLGEQLDELLSDDDADSDEQAPDTLDDDDVDAPEPVAAEESEDASTPPTAADAAPIGQGIDATISAEERAVAQAMAKALGNPPAASEGSESSSQDADDAAADDAHPPDAQAGRVEVDAAKAPPLESDALAQSILAQAGETSPDDEALSRTIQAAVDKAMHHAAAPPAAEPASAPSPGEEPSSSAAPETPASTHDTQAAADVADDEDFDATFEPPPDADEPSPEVSATQQAQDASDLVGEDLANEIQQLLDEAKTSADTEIHFESPEDVASPTAAPAATTQADGHESRAAAGAGETVDEDDLGGAFETVDEVERGGAASDAEGETVEQIDEMLADMADEAVAGEFETVADVLAMEAAGETPRGTSLAEQESDADADGLEGADDDLAGDFASPDELLDSDGDDMDFDGAFEAPEDLEPAAVGASASDVSDELDSQPESAAGAGRRRRQQSNDDDEDGRPGDDARTGGFASRVRRMVITAAHEAPEHARNTCAVLNRPLRRVSPQTRNLVGYAGLMTLFFGTTLLALTFLGVLPR